MMQSGFNLNFNSISGKRTHQTTIQQAIQRFAKYVLKVRTKYFPGLLCYEIK